MGWTVARTTTRAHLRGTMKHACWALPLLFLSACGDGKADAAKAQAAADSAAAALHTVINLVAYDMPLLLTPPDKQLTNGSDPVVQWKEEIGRLEITIGDHFGLAITEEPGDLARLKADLDRDLLQKNTVVKETPDLLVFRSEFPDDPGLVFLHFYRVITAGNRTFIVQDLDGSQFNEQDIDRMVTCLAPAIPA